MLSGDPYKRSTPSVELDQRAGRGSGSFCATSADTLTRLLKTPIVGRLTARRLLMQRHRGRAVEMRDDQNTTRFLRVCDRGGERQRQCKRGRESSPISPHHTYLPRRSRRSRRRDRLAELPCRMPTAAGYTAADRGAIPAGGSERLRRERMSRSHKTSEPQS
jgi:hypothetical protein